MRDLTRGPVSGHILALAIPIAIGMFVQTLYFLVDLFFVSRLGGTALAGVSAAGNSAFLIFALTQMLSVGTISTVAHAVGAGDKPKANLIFNQAVMLAGVLALGTLVGGYFGLADFYITTIGADAQTAAAGSTYLNWFIPSMAFQFAIAAMGAALQGTGIVKPTMVVQMLTVVTNIILTPVLIAGWGTGFPLGVAGAGLASSISAGLGVALMAFYFVNLEHYVGFDATLLRPRPAVLKQMLSIGAPAGGEFGLLFVYLAVIYQVIGPFGAEAQAGFGIGFRMMQAIFLPALAIAFAIPAIVGQNFGAKNAVRVRRTFHTAVVMNVAFMVLLTLLAKWRPEWLVAGFSTDEETLAVATTFLTIVSWNFVASGLTFTCSGVFQGIGNTLPALASTASRLVTFVFPVLWLAARPGFEIRHVWYLSVATVALQALISLTLLHRQLRRRLIF